MRTSARAHYVRPNHATRIPRSYIYLDTEAQRTTDGRRETQSFRLAVAAYDTRNSHKDGWRDREWAQFTDTETLWAWVGSRCRTKARTILVAHNLAYDVRISRAFVDLPALGWTFKMGRLDAKQAWLVWTLGSRTLFMVDSMSWVPVALERLGEMCEIPKLRLPDWDDDDEAWFARCRRDVEILAESWSRLMRWVETEDLGNWKPSGAGQSWAAYRHRFMPHRLLVHEDDDARAAERAACHTGRCEVWRWGRLDGGPFTEWDFSNAYCRIGAESWVPAQYVGELAGRRKDRVLDLSGARTALVECTVTSDVPTVPKRTVEGIAWPVGTFTTTLWSNELTLARDEGATVTVDRAWLYRTSPALGGFCRWVLDGLDPQNLETDPVVRVALKHWSRALIGRTAAQWPRWQRWGTSPELDVRLGTVIDVSAGERWDMLHLGYELWQKVGVDENPDAMVAILSWVMAEARCRLWRAMRVAGLEHVCYVDTDSLFTGPAGSERLAAAAIPGLRVKGMFRSLECLAPRQIIPEGRLRASGVPLRSVRVAERAWQGDVWSGLATSLRNGEPTTVEIASRTFQLSGRDKRRRHVADGRTEAFAV